MTRLAVGLFGLDRRPDITHAALLTNVLSVARHLDPECVVAAHLNWPRRVHSPRSHEINLPYERPRLGNLDPDIAWVERQNDDNIAPQLLAIAERYLYRGIDDPEKIMRSNALQQMWSQWRLAGLLEQAAPYAEVFALVRPDLLYDDPLPLENCCQQIRDGVHIITPSWHRHDGLNDRFAVVSRTGLEVYTRRLFHVEALCALRGSS